MTPRSCRVCASRKVNCDRTPHSTRPCSHCVRRNESCEPQPDKLRRPAATRNRPTTTTTQPQPPASGSSSSSSSNSSSSKAPNTSPSSSLSSEREGLEVTAANASSSSLAPNVQDMDTDMLGTAPQPSSSAQRVQNGEQSRKKDANNSNRFTRSHSQRQAYHATDMPTLSASPGPSEQSTEATTPPPTLPVPRSPEEAWQALSATIRGLDFIQRLIDLEPWPHVPTHEEHVAKMDLAQARAELRQYEAAVKAEEQAHFQHMWTNYTTL